MPISKGHRWSSEAIRKRAMTRAGGDWPERFLKFVSPEPNSGCWLWLGAANKKGYGQISDGTRVVLATHMSLRLFKEPLRPGQIAMHKCDVPCCVNPDHLIAGTPQQNMDDMWRKGRAGPRDGLPGCMNPNARLNDRIVIEIRARAAVGETHRSIAREFGVTRTTVSGIVKRSSWAHV